MNINITLSDPKYSTVVQKKSMSVLLLFSSDIIQITVFGQN